MILTVDIGNTNIVFGGFLGGELSFVARIATNPTATADEYASKIKSILSLHRVDRKDLKGAIISSVVPPISSVMKEAIKIVYGVEALMVKPGIKTGLRLECDDPASVGADLICACVAAQSLYGSPCLVIDMGTATKILMVNKDGAFAGASIIPGVAIALSALAGGTAQLPQISLEAPPSVMGKNTADCMRSGAVLGHASMLDGMIERFNKEAGEDLRVIATGGYASTIIPHCNHNITLDKDLLLKGLYILYNKNQG